MTPKEFQAEIEAMLTVQRHWREEQLRSREQMDSLRITTEGLVRASEALLLTQLKTDERMDRLAESQIQLTEQTLQLKRAVDHLLSKDGD